MVRVISCFIAAVALVLTGCGSSSATLPIPVGRAAAVVQDLYFDPQLLTDEQRHRRGHPPAYVTDVGYRPPVIAHHPPNAAGEVVSTIAIRGKFMQRWTTISLQPVGLEQTRVVIVSKLRESFLGVNETWHDHDWSYQQERLAEIRKAVADPHPRPLP